MNRKVFIVISALFLLISITGCDTKALTASSNEELGYYAGKWTDGVFDIITYYDSTMYIDPLWVSKRVDALGGGTFYIKMTEPGTPISINMIFQFFSDTSGMFIYNSETGEICYINKQ